MTDFFDFTIQTACRKDDTPNVATKPAAMPAAPVVQRVQRPANTATAPARSVLTTPEGKPRLPQTPAELAAFVQRREKGTLTLKR